jgi:hypothetical protein
MPEDTLALKTSRSKAANVIAPTPVHEPAVYRIKRMVGRKILGLKCRRPDIRDGDGHLLLEIPSMATGAGIKYLADGGIDKTDALNYRNTKDWTNWVKVVKIGPSCKYFHLSWWQDHDVFMMFPEFGDKFHSVGENYYVIDESWLDPEENVAQNAKPSDPNWKIKQRLPGFVTLIPRSKA